MPKTAPLKFLFNAFLAHHRYDKRGASAMIIIDLEWNSGSDYSGFDEILQIGAVRIKTLGGCILDTFNIYVKPQVNTTLHPAAVKLPELWHSFADGVCFPVAFLKFREWARHEKDYIAWGEDDFRVLQQNVTYWNLPPLSIRAAFNLQRGFGQHLGTNAQIALCKAVSYCKIPESFTFHDALNDAVYAALLTSWILSATSLQTLFISLRLLMVIPFMPHRQPLLHELFAALGIDADAHRIAGRHDIVTEDLPHLVEQADG